MVKRGLWIITVCAVATTLLWGCGKKAEEPTDAKETKTKTEVSQEKEEPEEKTMEGFCDNFIRTFLDAVRSGEAVPLDHFIANENLASYEQKAILIRHQSTGMMPLCKKPEEYEIKLEEKKIISENEVYFLYFSVDAYGSVAPVFLLVKEEKDGWGIVDCCACPGPDTLDYSTMGNRRETRMDNPDIWNDEEWVASINQKTEEYCKKYKVELE
ncbi:hypothetical protein SAMN02910358_01279 [Lachnospiraceae bacterium XBB1006]|nr:hypothetical protein SAMN02910358_01279 [Lachnospiraceae bacterium XBB1006]